MMEKKIYKRTVVCMMSTLLLINFISPMQVIIAHKINMENKNESEQKLLEANEEISDTVIANEMQDKHELINLVSENRTEKGMEKNGNASLLYSELALAHAINRLPPGASAVYDLQIGASATPISPIVISEGKDIKIISTTNSTVRTGYRVEEGSSLTFGDGLTYQGNTDPSNRVGVTIDGNNAEFILDGGRITNIRSDRAAAVDIIDGHFRMINGLIDNNNTRGVRVLNGNFTMTGGSIENNTMNNGNGGGVSVSENGSLTVTGGSIRGNTASDGGGIFVESLTKSNITINNGVVFNGNSANSTRRPPLNVESVFPNIQTRSSSVADFSHPLNNMDIGFNSVSPAINTLSVLKNLDEGGNINVADEINVSTREIFQGTSTYVQAVSSPGYRFVCWEVNGAGSKVINSIDASTTFKIGSEDAVLTAVFERVHTLMLQASPTTGGTPTIETPSGGSTGTVAEGGVTTLHANPNEGYRFVKWVILSSSGSTIADANSPTTTFTMGSSFTSVRAEYELIPHTLNVQASPSTGGNPTAEQTTLGMGQTTNLTANPNEGYRFLGWTSSDGGEFEDANNPITTFTMPNNNTTVTANFIFQETELTFLDFFPDLNLANTVADRFGRETTDEVSEEELNSLTGTINGDNRNISDIEGIQYLTSISRLTLFNNRIKDLTPLSYLTNMTFLEISNNQISDLEPLEKLANLVQLYANHNDLTNQNIKHLANLPSLVILFLNNNHITDLSIFSNPDLVISALDQDVRLDPINQDEVTEGIFIKVANGQAPLNITFSPTGGSYEKGVITWATTGENTLTWFDSNFSGTITQFVSP